LLHLVSDPDVGATQFKPFVFEFSGEVE
jgi:hypothetical protein